MPGTHRWKLFLMMVLQFFIWGAWLPLVFGYIDSLGFSKGEQAAILDAFPIAAIVGMVFSNQFADRNFAAEKFLAVSHLIGGLAMLGLGFTREFWPFVILMYLHCLVYVPTISITNAIAFTHLKDAKREFGLVRMGGTIGWILAAWPFAFVFVDWQAVAAANPQGLVNWLGEALAHPLTGDAAKAATKWTFVVAGGASMLLAALALGLPHTPPRATESLAWAKAFRLLRHPFVLVLWVVAFADSFVHNCYFNWTGTFLGSAQVGIPSNWIMPVMSIGQVAEILTMAALGAVLARLGWRWTMVVGVLGHAARFFVFAHFPQHAWLVVVINVLHGICYAFFFATVYIFVDTYLPKDIRSSAQGLFNLMILGGGALVANTWCGTIKDAYTTRTPTDADPTKFDAAVDWHGLFEVPMFIALVAAAVLAFNFRPPAAPSEDARDGGGAGP
ncbi:MAG TPA: MFS transporter [Planctomycetota bacterium]|nr:MFS transporter [Planctomycetota bacterium]